MRGYYFPVEAKPLRMVPSLFRFGTDFGLGADDARFFQVDGTFTRYCNVKRRSSAKPHLSDDDVAKHTLRHVLYWMETAMRDEGLRSCRDEGLRSCFAESALPKRLVAIAESIQEDFAILHEGTGDGRVVGFDIRFPSGWCPERLGNAGFQAIHGPVPDFPANDRASRAMVQGMIERGPYVRFVWTLSPEDVLDQHPERYDRQEAWQRSCVPYLRVERQVTVPFPRARASLFLIRVHQRSWSELTPTDRATLKEALRVMPDHVRRYKGLPERHNLEELFERADTTLHGVG